MANPLTWKNPKATLPSPIPSTPKAPSGWYSGLDVVSTCGKCPKATVLLHPHVHQIVQAMLLALPTTEWLGYLTGELRGNDLLVSGITFPSQEVTMASVEVTKPEFPQGLVGVIHSHHSMGSFFSSTDTHGVNTNHKLSIVVSTKDGYKATLKSVVACGATVSNEVQVTVRDPDFFTAAIVEDAKKKITENQQFATLAGVSMYIPGQMPPHTPNQVPVRGIWPKPCSICGDAVADYQSYTGNVFCEKCVRDGRVLADELMLDLDCLV